MIAAFAESARLPFDLPEAEQELIGGYHTEYSGMRLLLYLIAEFLHMVTAAFLIVILFLGGWHLWGLTGSGNEVTWVTAILRVLVLMAKVLATIFFMMMVRWSWPRFRFDQLMALAWKVMLPLGLINLVVMAFVVEYQAWFARTGLWASVALGWAVLVVSTVTMAVLAPLATDNRARREIELETPQRMYS
jgi:NADH-quinone oxidoreductase subunit H